MEQPELYSIIAAITTLLVGFGLEYAYLIYVRPFPPNQTSYSVVIGVAFTLVLAGLIQLVVLIYLGLASLWWLLLIPGGAFVITGIPQIYVERKKEREQDVNNERYERELRINNG